MPRDDLTPPRAKMFKELDEMATKHPEYADLAERVKAEIKRLLVWEERPYVRDLKMKPGEIRYEAGVTYYGPDTLT